MSSLADPDMHPSLDHMGNSLCSDFMLITLSYDFVSYASFLQKADHVGGPCFQSPVQLSFV